ncbi:MAG: ATP-grasp domain-containing protein [Pirellulales bacterium]|nr:ATP-grasp domain-containing protein [Pirellulales bacterium]
MQVIRPPKRSVPNGCPRSHRILALCGDTQVGLWMLRSLAKHGLTVFAVCNTPKGQAAHSRYCSGSWFLDRSPGAAPPAEQVLNLARQLEVGSVMPISESYHAKLIESRDQFEPDIHVFSPTAETFAKATDKDYMHALCVELGVPVANGMTLERLMEGDADKLQFPLVMRTSRQNDPQANGQPSWKAAYVDDQAQLDKLYQEVRRFADNVLVQEYHPGAEDHVQVLIHQGEAFMAGEYIGEHHMPLAGGVTVQRVTCRHEPVIDDAVRLLKAIGWEGIAGVQFHYDPQTDKYIFLEINPRFIGGLPTVIMAGFHAPFLAWQSYFEPDKMKRPDYRLGLRTRILGGDANWMFGMIRGDQLPPGQSRLNKLSAVTRFLWNFGPWTKDDSFMLADMKPFLVDFRQMLRRLRSETFDIIGDPQTQENQR